MEKIQILEKQESPKDHYRSLIDKAGIEGKYQKIIFLILNLVAFTSSLTITFVPYQKELPTYYCFNRFDFEDNSQYLDYKLDSKYRIHYNEECIYSLCKSDPSFENEHLTLVVADYSTITNFVTEMDLLCDVEEYFAEFTQNMFSGRVIGLLVYSYVADAYGRVNALYLQLFLSVLANLFYLFIKNKTLILIIVILANASTNLFNLVNIMSTEYMSQSWYNVTNSFLFVNFSACGLVSLLIMYFFKNWNIILVVQILIQITIFFITNKYLVETPLFLLETFKFKELGVVLKKISSFNLGPEENEKLIKEIDNSPAYEIETHPTESSKGYGLYEIFNKILGPYLLILKSSVYLIEILKYCFPIYVNILVYYGQLMYVEELDGNLYFNLFVIFMTEIIFESLAGWFMQYMSLKNISYVTHTINIFVCYVVYLNISPVINTILIFIITMNCSVGSVAGGNMMSEQIDVKVKSSSISLIIIFCFTMMMFSARIMRFVGSSYLTFSIFSIFAVLNFMLIKLKPVGPDVVRSH